MNHGQHFSFKTLQQRVEKHFLTINQDLHSPDWSMWVKVLVLFPGLFLNYFLLITNYFNSDVMTAVLCHTLIIFIVFNMICVLHDMIHGSFIKNTAGRTIASYVSDLMGASHLAWYSRHNICHHYNTNHSEQDIDLQATSVFRFAEGQPHHSFHRYQPYYAPLGYLLYGFYWFFIADLEKIISGKVSHLKMRHLTPVNIFLFFFFKVLHLVAGVIIPVYIFGPKAVLVYLYIISLSAFIVATLNQLAHVFKGASYHQISTYKSRDHFALTQISTTSCFHPESTLVTFITGGINLQLVHHLFPEIPHCHYPEIFKILKIYAKECNIKLHQFNNLTASLKAHWQELARLGAPID